MSLIKKKLCSKISKTSIVTRNLLKNLDFPLAAPSANISKRLSAVTPSDVKEDFGKKINIYLNGGKSSIGVESTIIDLLEKTSNFKIRWFKRFKYSKNIKKKILIIIILQKFLTWSI